MGFGGFSADFFKRAASKIASWQSPGAEIRTERFRNTRSAVIQAVEPAVVAGAITAQQTAFPGAGTGFGGGGGGAFGGPSGPFAGGGGGGGALAPPPLAGLEGFADLSEQDLGIVAELREALRRAGVTPEEFMADIQAARNGDTKARERVLKIGEPIALRAEQETAGPVPPAVDRQFDPNQVTFTPRDPVRGGPSELVRARDALGLPQQTGFATSGAEAQARTAQASRVEFLDRTGRFAPAEPQFVGPPRGGFEAAPISPFTIDRAVKEFAAPVTGPIGEAIGTELAKTAVLPAQPARIVGEALDIPGLRSIPSQDEAAEAVRGVAREISEEVLNPVNAIPLPIIDPAMARILGLGGKLVTRTGRRVAAAQAKAIWREASNLLSRSPNTPGLSDFVEALGRNIDAALTPGEEVLPLLARAERQATAEVVPSPAEIARRKVLTDADALEALGVQPRTQTALDKVRKAPDDAGATLEAEANLRIELGKTKGDEPDLVDRVMSDLTPAEAPARAGEGPWGPTTTRTVRVNRGTLDNPVLVPRPHTTAEWVETPAGRVNVGDEVHSNSREAGGRVSEIQIGAGTKGEDEAFITVTSDTGGTTSLSPDEVSVITPGRTQPTTPRPAEAPARAGEPAQSILETFRSPPGANVVEDVTEGSQRLVTVEQGGIRAAFTSNGLTNQVFVDIKLVSGQTPSIANLTALRRLLKETVELNPGIRIEAQFANRKLEEVAVRMGAEKAELGGFVISGAKRIGLPEQEALSFVRGKGFLTEEQMSLRRARFLLEDIDSEGIPRMFKVVDESVLKDNGIKFKGRPPSEVVEDLRRLVDAQPTTPLREPSPPARAGEEAVTRTARLTEIEKSALRETGTDIDVNAVRDVEDIRRSLNVAPADPGEISGADANRLFRQFGDDLIFEPNVRVVDERGLEETRLLPDGRLESATPLREGAEPVSGLPGEAPSPDVPAQAVDDFEPVTVDDIAQLPPERPTTIGGAGEQFAAPLRPIEDVASEVVTGRDPIKQALARVGISPSLLDDSEVGRAITAYYRQRGSAEQLTSVTLASALDSKAQQFTGRTPFRIGDDAIATLGDGTKVPWNDLFSTDKFRANLTDVERAYIDDYRRVVAEMEFLRVQAGLKPRATSGPESAEGWFYIPRQVEGIRGMELRRPSSPGLQRHYEEAVEGIENGIRYESDPRAVLDLHVRNAYKEIIDKQLADFLEPLSISPKQFLPEPVRIRMEQAVAARLAAERNLRSLRTERLRAQTGGRFVGEDAQAQQVLREAKAPQRQRIASDVTAAQSELDVVMREYNAAKAQRARAMEAARKAELAPGNLFGKAEDVIPVGQWRNRFFPLEDAKRLNENLGAFMASPKNANWVGRGFEVLGNHIRFLSAIGDFAAPFIQGIPLLARNPVGWSRAALRHYQAFADPTVQARFIREHMDTLQEMAAHNVPVGDVEFFKALQEGGGLSPGRILELLPKGGKQARLMFQQAGKQTFGRFQASYDMFLTSARVQLWEGMKPNWQGSLDDLAAHVRNMTGGLDSRALGVGPTQRGIESTWLAFSPRLLRSTVALTADLASTNASRRFAAWRTLSTLVAGTVGIYIASAIALGKSEEELRTGLNPLEGKKYLSHEINGDWVGIGGQVRAISQLLARSAADPGALTSADRFDNPLLSFISSRGAVGVSLASGVIEATTGVDAEPFDNIDSLPDLFKHIGMSSLPFALQGVLEGEKPLTTAIALVGARTSPQTPTEALASAWNAAHPDEPFNREIHFSQAEQEFPELVEEVRASSRQFGSATSVAAQERERVLGEEEQGLVPFSQGVLRGDLNAGEKWREQRSDFLTFSAGTAAQAFDRFDIKANSPEGKLLQSFYDIDIDKYLNLDTLETDFAAFDAARQKVLDELARTAPLAAQGIEGRITSFTDTDNIAVERMYQDARPLVDQLYGDDNLGTFTGISQAGEQRLREFMRDVTDQRKRFEESSGRSPGVEESIRALGRIRNLDQAFIDFAVRIRPGSSSRDALKNIEREIFLLRNVDVLRPLYPGFYDSSRMRQALFRLGQIRQGVAAR